MKTTKADSQRMSRTANPDAPDWLRERVPSLRAKSDAKPFGYPSVRQYHPPTEAERMAEDVERWDGLS